MDKHTFIGHFVSNYVSQHCRNHNLDIDDAKTIVNLTEKAYRLGEISYAHFLEKMFLRK